MHCRVEGPAARGRFDNFVERWARAATGENADSPNLDGFDTSDADHGNDDDDESWTVQTYRSANLASVDSLSEDDGKVVTETGTLTATVIP